MSMRSALLATAVLAGIILFLGFRYRERGGAAMPFRVPPGDARLLALLNRASAIFTIGKRSRESGCETNGPLPDHFCTPGALFPDATAGTICIPGYTETVRNVPVSLKARVYAAYGLTYPQEPGAYEVDHLIPLELGGSNDIANLFPEAAEPTPGFHEKDFIENYLHDEVCSGSADLSAAQKQIANDWLAVYDTFSP